MVRSGIRSYLDAVRRQLSEAPAAWLAFAALLAWMFGLYWSDLFVARVSTAQLDFLQLRALWLAVEAGTLLVAFACVRFVSERSLPVAVGAGSCLFAGTVLVLFAPADAASDALRVAGVALTGFGSAVLLVLQGIGFARKGPKPLLINVALALLVASVSDSVLLYLPSGLQPMIVSLLPVVCVVLLAVSAHGDSGALGASLSGSVASGETPSASAVSDPSGTASSGSDSPTAVAPAATSATPAPAALGASPSGSVASSNRAIAIRVVALPLVVGLAYGLMQRLTGDAYTSGAAEVNVATIVSFFLSAVFIALAALFFDSRKLIKLVCFVAIPIIGIAFVMLPLFSDAGEAAQAICIIGFNSFYFMVWALWAGDQGGLALPKRFILGLFVLVGAESLGSVIGMQVMTAVRDSGSTLAVVSLVVVYLLLMAGIFSFDRSGGAREPQAERPQASPAEYEGLASPTGTDAAVLEGWAKRFGLSARETEVFMLLAKGRNRVYISKELFISDNTTRTHMKNVYRKLGVHSQQELIDLLEGKGAGGVSE